MEHEEQHKLKEISFSSSRIESLTDGIFAFAMTLLVLNLNAPELYGVVTNEELFMKLSALSQRFFIFLLSFFLLASMWGVHHRQFSYIKRSNSQLMWINMIRLLFVIVIPFSSVLVGSYPDLEVAAFFFSINVFFLCVVSYFEWLYAIRHHLTEGLPREHQQAGNLKNIFSVAVAGAASIISIFDASLGLWTFALFPFIIFILKKVGKIV